MIRNVVFDMGGVLIAWDPDRIVARLGLSEEDSRLLRREVFQSVEWVCLDRGSLSEQEALESMGKRLPERLREAALRCIFWWKDELWPVPGMAELIRELDSQGYIVAGEDGVTSCPGFFAAGDVRTKNLRQVSTAVGDGANALHSVQDYLKMI